MEPDRRRAAHPHESDLCDLLLLHLADSALPVGALAHSFGIESLMSIGASRVADLPSFLQGYLEEAGLMEAFFCRAAYGLAGSDEQRFPVERWIELNDWMSAESRRAKVVLAARRWA